MTTQSEIWLPPFYCVEGDELVFSGPWLHITPASADFKVYEDAEDKTATYATGSITIDGSTVTFKKLQSLVGGKVLVVAFIVTGTNSQKVTMKMELHVEKSWEKM